MNRSTFRRQLENELVGNILPVWMEHVVDRVNGGFYGAVTNDRQVHDEVPRSAILCARILWAYTAAYRRLGTATYLAMARHAYDYLRNVFWDREMIEIFLQHILDPDSGHLRIFFDDQWRSLSANVSFGHDIEASWLLWEAAQVASAGTQPTGTISRTTGTLSAAVHDTAVDLAAAVYRDGLDDDGSLFYESGSQGLVNGNKAWWVQAEAVVGFYNAYQISGQVHFKQAAERCWTYIQAHVVDRTHGEWFKELYRDGRPNHNRFKAGPWDYPYHHSRACLEMLARLDRETKMESRPTREGENHAIRLL